MQAHQFPTLHLNVSEQFMCHAIRHRDHLDINKLKILFQLNDEESLYSECVKNGVDGIAFDALKHCEGLDVANNWSNKFQEDELRISEYMEELDRIAELLAEHEIPLIALKNSGIARALYPIHGASPMGDLDVLVKKEDFRRAHSVLINSGYEMEFRSDLEEANIEKAEQNGGSEYLSTLPSGRKLWFELQWRPVAGRWIQADQEPTSVALFDKAISVGRSNVKLLSPEDNLLQVALHTAKHTYVRAPGFRLHTDVDRVVHSSQIDWNEFTENVIRLKVKTPVYFSLLLAALLLDTPIPEKVLESTKPAKWKVKLVMYWLQKVGLFNPDEKKWNRLGYIVFVLLLYDDLTSVFKGIFPSAKVMKERHGAETRLSLGYYYAKRIIALVFRRKLN